MRPRHLIALAGFAAAALLAQQYSPSRYNGMRWRQVGPSRAGRISAVAGVPGDPATHYLGTPGGGIFKSTSGGVTWKPIFDETHIESIPPNAAHGIQAAARPRAARPRSN